MIYFNTRAHNDTPGNACNHRAHQSQDLCENILISLQHAFLINGFHHLKADTLKEGRAFLCRQLRSLNYYHHIAYLAAHYDQDDTAMMTDIFYDLHQEWGEPTYNTLADYFFESWYFDFLWIEQSEELYKRSWYYYFLQLLKDFDLPRHIPIFTMTTC